MSRYLYALHDENDWQYGGWEIRAEQIGHDPSHTGGTDYRGARHTVIARFQNGWSPEGCIPLPSKYDDFATRAANFVKNSQGCSRWIIGNEMNHAQERPFGQLILPSSYAHCYSLCRKQIHALPGHADDEVIVGAVAPYNNQTPYPGNERGDWVRYFRDVLDACEVVDGIAIHCYGRSQSPSDPSSDSRMGGEFAHLHDGFRAYRDFLDAVPESMRLLPLYITETNPGANGTPWADRDAGWVTAAYDEIAEWNATRADREIRCLALYRWSTADMYTFRHKPNVQRDFERAVAKGYTWEEPTVPDPDPGPDPEPEPTECLYDEDRLRAIVREEMAVLYAGLRDAMAEEVRKALDATRLMGS